MKKVVLLLVTTIAYNANGIAQKANPEFENFIRTELTAGNHTFSIMTNQVISKTWEKTRGTEQNENIQDTDFNEDKPILAFRSSGTIQLNITHTDSLCVIRPVENSFFPSIDIDLKSRDLKLNDQLITNGKEVVIDNKKNVFKSEWSGYQWRLSETSLANKVQPRATFGKLETNNNIYIEVLWIENGKKTHYRLLDRQ